MSDSAFNNLFSDIGQGAEDIGRAGLADVQNHYQEFLTGQTAPMTAPIGDMETTVTTAPEPASTGPEPEV